MLVSAVPDPSAFDISNFDDAYREYAEDFLSGIKKNGVLIVDRGKRILHVIINDIRSDPNRYGKRLVTKFEEILKNKKRRIVMFGVSQDSASLKDLLELSYHLKTEADTDALIVGEDSLQKLKSQQKIDASIIPLSDYRNSDFEKNRDNYLNNWGEIDKLTKHAVDDLIIRAVQFSKRLRFYDPYIGSGNNISNFRKGIDYILTLWKDNCKFSIQQGANEIEIYTCCATQILAHDKNHVKRSKLSQNKSGYQTVIRGLVEPLEKKYPQCELKLYVKNDPNPNRIFHARYLEAQQAIIRIDKGFDLFKQDGTFRRNFLTLNMTEGSHLRECRELMDWNP